MDFKIPRRYLTDDEIFNIVVSEFKSVTVLHKRKITNKYNINFKQFKFLYILILCLGNVTRALSLLDLPYAVFNNWVQQDNFALAYRNLNVENILIDLVHDKLLQKALQEGNTSLLKFVMENKGARRGYLNAKALRTLGEKAGMLENNENNTSVEAGFTFVLHSAEHSKQIETNGDEYYTEFEEA